MAKTLDYQLEYTVDKLRNQSQCTTLIHQNQITQNRQQQEQQNNTTQQFNKWKRG